MPENYWDATAGKVKDAEFGQHLKDLTAFKAAEDSRKLSLPQKPDDYQIALPKDFKAPEGIELKWDDKSPALAEARKLAHELGIGQEGFSKLLSVYAGSQMQAMTEFKAARDAQIAQLGPSGPARVDAVTNWMKASLGDDATKAMLPMLVTADIVKGFETIIQKVTSQGAGGFSQAHRENAPENGKIEGFEKMSFAQKRAAQDALARNQSGGR